MPATPVTTTMPIARSSLHVVGGSGARDGCAATTSAGDSERDRSSCANGSSLAVVRAQDSLAMGPIEALDAGVLVGFISAFQSLLDGRGYSVR